MCDATKLELGFPSTPDSGLVILLVNNTDKINSYIYTRTSLSTVVVHHICIEVK